MKAKSLAVITLVSVLLLFPRPLPVDGKTTGELATASVELPPLVPSPAERELQQETPYRYYLFSLGVPDQLRTPTGVTVAPDGTIYVADSGHHCIQHFSALGAFLGAWGSGGSGDGQFNWPASVAVAPDGTIYVADRDNNRVQYFSATGEFLGMWGTKGLGDGQFNAPGAVRVAPDGETVYVADAYNDRIQYFSATGQFLGKWGTYGSGDGQLIYPRDIALAADGTVYVADSDNHRIQHFSATGEFLGKWGSHGSSEGQFASPYGVAVAPDGTVYVADTFNSRIQHFTAAGEFLGQWSAAGSGEGQFLYPGAVAVAADKTAYVADTWNSRIQVFVPAYPAAWRGEFFDNVWLDGPVRAVVYTSTLDFEWATEAPDPGVSADYFSDRWWRYVSFTGGNYTFTLVADDGVRFWIDDQQMVDAWEHQQRGTYTVNVALNAGYHRLTIEHRENEGVAALGFYTMHKVYVPIVLRNR